MSCRCSCHRSNDHLPVTPDNDAVESTATLVARIDDEIARNREHLRSLLWQRNAVVAVNHLPVELLSLIFSMVQERWRKPDPLRLAITHVCKQWRFVALSCPALWNYVEIGSSWGPPFVNEMIQRAKGLPLLINIETQSNLAFGEALKLAPLARQLRVYLEDSDHVDTFNDAVESYTMWDARSLVLESSDCDDTINLPDIVTIFRLQVLHLHEVSIGGVPRDQGVSQLTTLAIRSARAPCAIFWDMMNYANQVEILWVEAALPNEWFSDLYMNLPNLRLLSITDNIDSLIDFLNHLQPAAGARLHLNVVDASYNRILGLDLCQSISRHMPQQPGFQEVAIEFMKDCAHMFGWLETPASGDPNFDIRLFNDSHNSKLWTVHALFIRLWAHNAANIKTLRLHASVVVDPQAWGEWQRASPDLCRLYVSGPDAWCLISEISPSVYPKLSVLDISQAEMGLDNTRHLEGLLLKWQREGLRLQQLIASKGNFDIPGIASQDTVYVFSHNEYGGFTHQRLTALAQRQPMLLYMYIQKSLRCPRLCINWTWRLLSRKGQTVC
jgi:hypothetical protein